MGSVIKLIYSQFLRKRRLLCLYLFSSLVRAAETVGLPIKVREMGCLGFPRQGEDTHVEL